MQSPSGSTAGAGAAAEGTQPGLPSSGADLATGDVTLAPHAEQRRRDEDETDVQHNLRHRVQLGGRGGREVGGGLVVRAGVRSVQSTGGSS